MSLFDVLKKTLFLFSENWFISRKKFLISVLIIVSIFSISYIALDFNEKMNGNKSTYFCYNEIPNDTIFKQIWNKIYMSFTTLTTLGYGDIYPIHPLSQFITAFQTFITFSIITDLVR
jgi:hypothetical protein|tara:strand:- start:90 stop:443 length:354 start_codon:yes stop_codon:yes gene_type:complete